MQHEDAAHGSAGAAGPPRSAAAASPAGLEGKLLGDESFPLQDGIEGEGRSPVVGGLSRPGAPLSPRAPPPPPPGEPVRLGTRLMGAGKSVLQVGGRAGGGGARGALVSRPRALAARLLHPACMQFATPARPCARRALPPYAPSTSTSAPFTFTRVGLGVGRAGRAGMPAPSLPRRRPSDTVLAPPPPPPSNLADDQTRQVEAHHYCTHLSEELRQCVVFDSGVRWGGGGGGTLGGGGWWHNRAARRLGPAPPSRLAPTTSTHPPANQPQPPGNPQCRRPGGEADRCRVHHQWAAV